MIRNVDGQPQQPIEPIPYNGGNEFLGVNMSEREEMQEMKDKNGDISYNDFFEWMLPTFNGKSFWEFLASRIRLYRMHLMNQGWKSRWFDPDSGSIILSDHVACKFGCQQCPAY